MESTGSLEFHPTFRNSGVEKQTVLVASLVFQALNPNFMLPWVIMGCYTLQSDRAAQRWAFKPTLRHTVFPICATLYIFSCFNLVLLCLNGCISSVTS